MWARCFAAVLTVAICLTEPPAAPEEIYVYAAASLRDVLQRLAPGCEEATGARLVFNFGASNDLARQIEAGNKADVFFSADEGWMDKVAQADLLDHESRRSLLSNRLVVIAPADSPLRIEGLGNLGAPHVRRFSLADPEAVPAGKYAKAWLQAAGVWEQIRERVLPAPDVRAALAAVEAGGAEVGIVYRTDAAISRNVRIVYEVPETEGPRISYPIAALRQRPHLEKARRVVAWLAGPKAGTVFEQFGFIVLRRAP